MPKALRKTSSGTLRIVAGNLRGSRLPVPNVAGLRPTSDRVRETLFNWLAPVIDGARCLDLYAGTGALGIEALSRGALECVFVERDRTLCRLLSENLLRLEVTQAQVINDDAQRYLRGTGTAFDVIFLDPPFHANGWSTATSALEAGGWLREGALVYVESPSDATFDLPSNWLPHREGRAGAVRFALYRRHATS